MVDLPAAAAAPPSGGGGATSPRPPSPPPPPPLNPPPKRKLRFLALHGFGQTGAVFRSRSGSWRKGLKSRADFFYLDAPFEAPGCGGAGLSWWGWHGGPEEGARPSRSDRPIEGWAEARATILSAMVIHAPIDGLLGFSQGAAAAGWAVSDLASGAAAYPPGVPPLRCAILAAGFIPGDAGARGAFEAVAGSSGAVPPSLLIAGEGDEIVEAARTAAVARAWGLLGEESGAASWLRHPGGHCLPTCSGGVKERLGGWLDGV